jgi:hypothetical protein
MNEAELLKRIAINPGIWRPARPHCAKRIGGISKTWPG